MIALGGREGDGLLLQIRNTMIVRSSIKREVWAAKWGLSDEYISKCALIRLFSINKMGSPEGMGSRKLRKFQVVSE